MEASIRAWSWQAMIPVRVSYDMRKISVVLASKYTWLSTAWRRGAARPLSLLIVELIPTPIPHLSGTRRYQIIQNRHGFPARGIVFKSRRQKMSILNITFLSLLVSLPSQERGTRHLHRRVHWFVVFHRLPKTHICAPFKYCFQQRKTS